MIRRIYDDMDDDEKRQFRKAIAYGTLFCGFLLAILAAGLLAIFGLVSIAMWSRGGAM